MLTFPEILIGVFGEAGLLLALILLVVLLPRRRGTNHRKSGNDGPLHRVNGRNGDSSAP